MGTNFYLHRVPDECASCHRPYERVHIGKSSHGWVFGWRGYRHRDDSPLSRPLTTPTEWLAALEATVGAGWEIRDEYDDPIPLADLTARIVGKRTPDKGCAARRQDLDSYTVQAEEGDDVIFCEFS